MITLSEESKVSPLESRSTGRWVRPGENWSHVSITDGLIRWQDGGTQGPRDPGTVGSRGSRIQGGWVPKIP